MVLLDYRENQKIAYTWDSAIVSFTLSQLENRTLISFEERIPEDFGNEFANAQKDMTGWLVQNECIQALLHLEDLPERKNLQEKWILFLEEKLKDYWLEEKKMTHNITCPHCGTAFQVNETEYSQPSSG